METPTIPCPYCQGHATYRSSSAALYRGKDYGPVYLCEPCGAYVGVHKGTLRAKGTPAKATLRTARVQAHRAFDEIWKGGHMRRGQAYRWLAEQLELDEVHIGSSGEERCESIRKLSLAKLAELRGADPQPRQTKAAAR